MKELDWNIGRLWNDYRVLFAAVLLGALVYFAFGGVGENEFILFDDAGLISSNTIVLQGLTWESIKWAFTTTLSGNWLPLTWLSHMTDVTLFGIDAGGHHLVSLFLHLLSVVILFETLYRFTGRMGAAVIAAILFGIHPLRVESVAWAAERKDVLSCLFGLLAVRAYLHYGCKKTVWRYVAVLILLTLGLMSKSMLVTWPFVFLLLDFWPLNRYLRPLSHCAVLPIPSQPCGSFIGLWLEKIPFFILAFIFSVIAFYAQRDSGAVVNLEACPVPIRIGNSIISYAMYLWKMIYPTKLALLYPFERDFAVSKLLLCGIILTGITVFVLMQWKKRPYLPVGWLWYLGTLVPVIGLVQIGNQGLADRYTYIPAIGISIMIGWTADEWLQRNKWSRLTVIMLMVIVSCVLTGITWRQVGFWKNSVTIFGRTLSVTGENNFVMRLNYANALKRGGEFEEAKKQCEEMQRIRPGETESLMMLGEMAQQTGNLDEAIQYWLEALQYKPKHSAFICYRLGSVYIQKEDYTAAEKYSKQAVASDPTVTGGYINLGILAQKQGRVTEAIPLWEKALAQNGNDVQALKHIAWILSTTADAALRNPARAVNVARRAAAISHNRSADVLDVLAAAYAANGQYDDAVQTAQQAIEIARRKQQETLVEAIKKRLALYRQHQSYQE